MRRPVRVCAGAALAAIEAMATVATVACIRRGAEPTQQAFRHAGVTAGVMAGVVWLLGRSPLAGPDSGWVTT